MGIDIMIEEYMLPGQLGFLAIAVGLFVWMNFMNGSAWVGFNLGSYPTYSWIALAAGIAIVVGIVNDYMCAESIVSGEAPMGLCAGGDTTASDTAEGVRLIQSVG